MTSSPPARFKNSLCVGPTGSLNSATWFPSIRSSSTVALILASATAVAPDLDAALLSLLLSQQIIWQPTLRLHVITCNTSVVLPLTACVNGSNSATGYSLAFAHVLRAEHPSLHFGRTEVTGIDSAKSSMQLQLSSFTQELCITSSGHAYTAVLRRSQAVVDAKRDEFNLSPRGELVVITGALGGLGLSSGTWLVKSGGYCVQLTSRSGRIARDGQGLQAILDRLLSYAHRVQLRICDASELSQAAFLATSSGKMCGLMHMPHVLKDRLIRFMEGDDLPYVFGAKASGAWNCHTVTSMRRIDFAFLFSSIATFGGLGIASHSSANGYLDAIAQCTRANGLKTRALIIPAVLEVGAAAAVALKAPATVDPTTPMAMMLLTINELLHFISLSICDASACTHGPMRSIVSEYHEIGKFHPTVRDEKVERTPAVLSRSLTSTERVSMARAATCALDSVIARALTKPPESTDVIIVGGGITGLTVASAMKQTGADLIVLEARASVGGVWRFYGNPHSRVNSTEVSFQVSNHRPLFLARNSPQCLRLALHSPRTVCVCNARSPTPTTASSLKCSMTFVGC
jgi:hypothetical protein